MGVTCRCTRSLLCTLSHSPAHFCIPLHSLEHFSSSCTKRTQQTSQHASQVDHQPNRIQGRSLQGTLHQTRKPNTALLLDLLLNQGTSVVRRLSHRFLCSFLLFLLGCGRLYRGKISPCSLCCSRLAGFLSRRVWSNKWLNGSVHPFSPPLPPL